MSASSAAGPAGRHAVHASSHEHTLPRVVVLVVALAAVGVAWLGSGALVGTPVPEVAGGVLSSEATLVAPDGPAFAIWAVIYVGLLALAVTQLVTTRVDLGRRDVQPWVVASLVLNAVWVLVVQAELLAVSVAVIVALLAVLVVTLGRLVRTPPTSTVEKVLLDGTMGLYLGWICIATVANVASALVDRGADATSPSATTWAELMLVVAGSVGLLLAVTLRGRVAPALGLAWGLAWVAVARTDVPESEAVAITAVVAAAATVLAVPVVRRRLASTPDHHRPDLDPRTHARHAAHR